MHKSTNPLQFSRSAAKILASCDELDEMVNS